MLNCAASRLEEDVARFEPLRGFSLDLEGEAALSDHSTRRDRMTMQPGRLAWGEADARTLHETDRRIGGGQCFFEQRLALELGKAYVVHASLRSCIVPRRRRGSCD